MYSPCKQKIRHGFGHPAGFSSTPPSVASLRHHRAGAPRTRVGYTVRGQCSPTSLPTGAQQKLGIRNRALARSAGLSHVRPHLADGDLSAVSSGSL